MKSDPATLDQRVRVLFEEDLAAMVFPTVKEFQFRVNSLSPLEVAAKSLALKNGHPTKWRDYSFSCVRHGQSFNEVIVDDLSRTFQSISAPTNKQEAEGPQSGDIVLFYRVKHLADKLET